MPKHILLFARKTVVWLKNREVILDSSAAELVFPYLHLITVPALHATVIDTQRRVGYNKFLVDAHHFPEAFAFRTGSQGRVEREHIVARLFELDTVGFETRGEIVGDVGWQEHDATLVTPLKEGRFTRIGQSRKELFRVVDRQSVNEQPYFLCFVGYYLFLSDFKPVFIFDEIFDSEEFSQMENSCIALKNVHLKLFLQSALFGNM